GVRPLNEMLDGFWLIFDEFRQALRFAKVEEFETEKSIVPIKVRKDLAFDQFAGRGDVSRPNLHVGGEKLTRLRIGRDLYVQFQIIHRCFPLVSWILENGDHFDLTAASRYENNVDVGSNRTQSLAIPS